MATSPTTITALPDAPNPNNRATFNALAYPWSNALVPWTVQVNNVAINVYSNAAEAYASTLAAEAQAQAAIAAVNSPKWVTGTNYAAGVTAWSPTNGRTYRTKVALNPSTVDPSLDPTNWFDIASLSGRPFTTISTNSAATRGYYHLITAPCTLTLPTTDLIVGSTSIEFLDITKSMQVYLDPGSNKIRGETGLMRLDAYNAAGTITWSGDTYGYV